MNDNRQVIDINLNININTTPQEEDIYEVVNDFDRELDEARSMPDDEKKALYKVVDGLLSKGEKEFCVSLMKEAPLFAIAEHLYFCLSGDINDFSMGQAYLVVENFKSNSEKTVLQ